MDLMSLPLVMIENIFSYLSFDDIAKTRLVSKPINDICSRILNRGFCLIERRHSCALKHVKSQLPRRESERRYHQLSRHCDILTSIETRISMLNMTYSKFIDHNMCCFIPGKVIDEIRRVLNLVETESSPPRAHEVLQELRDISSMAIEHFDDKIAPAFRKKLQEGAQPCRSTHSVFSSLEFRQELNNLRRRFLLHAKRSLYVRHQYRTLRKGMEEHKKLLWSQQKTIKQMARKEKEQDATIADLKKRIDECDIKYSELTHTNVDGKTLAGTGGSSSSQSLRHFSSQIKLDLSVLPIGTSKRNSGALLPNMKPRKPLIKLPSLSESEDEPPKKVPKLDQKKATKPKTTSDLEKIKVYTETSNSLQKRDIKDQIRQFSNKIMLKRGMNLDGHSGYKKPKMD